MNHFSLGRLVLTIAMLLALTCWPLHRAASEEAAPAPVAVAVADPVFDLAALLATPLNARTLRGPEEKQGVLVEEVMFHAEMDGDKSVDIFGILAYPKGAKGLPAFIWNQGGLSQASDYFPILGAKRGYTALCIDFPIAGYRSTGGYPINRGLSTTPDIRQAPIYHGAVALLKAVSFLEARPEVDKSRIGMCGSSWGGFYTTLMAGIDPRLKAASAMFGCGFLDSGNAWWGTRGSARFPAAGDADHWLATLDPGPRLARAQIPIGWFTGSNDMFYWMPSVMQSHATAAGPKHLTLYANWAHGLPLAGDEAVFQWLDVHLQGKPPLLAITPLAIQSSSGQRPRATWSFSGPRKSGSADLILSYGAADNWLSRYWVTLPATIGSDNTCSVELPAAPLPYFVSGAITDAQGMRSSTALVLVDVAALGLLDPKAVMDYDGCAMWGGFEPEHVRWSQLHAYMRITANSDAKAGKQAAQLGPGVHRIYPIYYTARWPHRFSAWVKADQDAQLSLRVGPQTQGETKLAVSTQWSQVSVDVTVTEDNGGLDAHLTVPAGVTVLLDEVSLRPLPAASR